MCLWLAKANEMVKLEICGSWFVYPAYHMGSLPVWLLTMCLVRLAHDTFIWVSSGFHYPLTAMTSENLEETGLDVMISL